MCGSAYQPEPANVRRSLEERLVLLMTCMCVCLLTWQLWRSVVTESRSNNGQTTDKYWYMILPLWSDHKVNFRCDWAINYPHSYQITISFSHWYVIYCCHSSPWALIIFLINRKKVIFFSLGRGSSLCCGKLCDNFWHNNQALSWTSWSMTEKNIYIFPTSIAQRSVFLCVSFLVSSKQH